MALYQSSQKLRLDSAFGEFKKSPALKAKAIANLGPSTGDGGAVTQATSRTTGVTLNKKYGAITTNTASLAAGAAATFTVTNSMVSPTDVPQVAIKSGTTTVQTRAYVSAVGNGTFNITINNGHASTAEVGAIVISFAIQKSVAA